MDRDTRRLHLQPHTRMVVRDRHQIREQLAVQLDHLRREPLDEAQVELGAVAAERGAPRSAGGGLLIHLLKRRSAHSFSLVARDDYRCSYRAGRQPLLPSACRSDSGKE